MKNNNKWYAYQPKLLCDFCNVYTVYKSGLRLHNTTWQTTGWRPMSLTICQPFMLSEKCILCWHQNFQQSTI